MATAIIVSVERAQGGYVAFFRVLEADGSVQVYRGVSTGVDPDGTPMTPAELKADLIQSARADRNTRLALQQALPAQTQVTL